MSQRLDVEADWNRVSPRYVGVVIVSSIVFGLVVCGIAVFFWLVVDVWWAWIALVLLGGLSVVRLIVAPRRARAIGYQLREDDLLIRRGIAWLRFVAVPYGRMQLIDISRGPLSRALGLSDLRFVTASASSNVEIPGLPEAEAVALRDRLVALAETRRAGL